MKYRGGWPRLYSASFGRLRQRLWNNHHVSMRVKSNIYRAIVLSTLLYGADAWTVYRRQVKKQHPFMMRHLRSIMRITWMDKVTKKDILERTGLPYMEDLIRKTLRWTGHLMRMSPDRLPKQVLYSQLSSGHRKRRRPRLRFKDTIKRNGSNLCRIATDSMMLLMMMIMMMMMMMMVSELLLILLYHMLRETPRGASIATILSIIILCVRACVRACVRVRACVCKNALEL